MNTYRLGTYLYGARFKKVATAIACWEPYLSMPFGEGWEKANRRAMEYLGDEQTTPLWFWR